MFQDTFAIEFSTQYTIYIFLYMYIESVTAIATGVIKVTVEMLSNEVKRIRSYQKRFA